MKNMNTKIYLNDNSNVENIFRRAYNKDLKLFVVFYWKSRGPLGTLTRSATPIILSPLIILAPCAVDQSQLSNKNGTIWMHDIVHYYV